MSEINVNNIVGDSFEDMSIAEMVLVQGAGDVDVQARSAITMITTVVVKSVVAASKSVAAATAQSSVGCGASVGATISLTRC